MLAETTCGLDVDDCADNRSMQLMFACHVHVSVTVLLGGVAHVGRGLLRVHNVPVRIHAHHWMQGDTFLLGSVTTAVPKLWLDDFWVAGWGLLPVHHVYGHIHAALTALEWVQGNGDAFETFLFRGLMVSETTLGLDDCADDGSTYLVLVCHVPAATIILFGGLTLAAVGWDISCVHHVNDPIHVAFAALEWMQCDGDAFEAVFFCDVILTEATPGPDDFADNAGFFLACVARITHCRNCNLGLANDGAFGQGFRYVRRGSSHWQDQDQTRGP
jgi:hypothetical protein